MYIRGGSKHQTKSSISLTAISSAVTTISSAAKFKKAYKCVINHHFVLGKGSPSFFFHLSFAVVPRGEFDNLYCCAPIQSKIRDALIWFIIKGAMLDWFRIAASLQYLFSKELRGKKFFCVYRDDLLWLLVHQHLININWKQEKQLRLFKAGTSWSRVPSLI